MAAALPSCGSSSSNTPTNPPVQTPVQNARVTATANNTFSPRTVTIFAGGTVTFTNAGGNHNVTGPGFRCANGCDGDGAGGNGNPATNAWTVTITFPAAGSNGYSCEVHVGVGMTGTVNVVASR